MKTIIAYNGSEISTIVTEKHYVLGDTIGGDKTIYAIIDGDAAYIDTKWRDANGKEWQTISYHDKAYNDAIDIAKYAEYRRHDAAWYLYNGDTQDFYEKYEDNLVDYLKKDLTLILSGDELSRLLDTLNLYDQGYENKAIRNGKVVYTEWIQRPSR